MAARGVRHHESIPEGAIELSEADALKHQLKLLDGMPSHRVIFLKYGGYMSAVVGSICSIVIVNHFRKAFRLGKISRFMMHIPGVTASCVFSVVCCPKYITNNILLMKDTCSLCNQLKFAGIKLYSSILHASCIGILGSSYVANIMSTYPLPDVRKSPAEYFRLIFRLLKEGAFKYQGVAAVELLFILFLTYNQNREFSNLLSSLESRTPIRDLDINGEFVTV